MKYEISITSSDVAVVWSVDNDDVRSIIGIHQGATQLFKLSTKHSVIGKTGAQIHWTAYPEAIVTADDRFDNGGAV